MKKLILALSMTLSVLLFAEHAFSSFGCTNKDKWLAASDVILSHATSNLAACKSDYAQMFTQLGCQNVVLDCKEDTRGISHAFMQLSFSKKTDEGYEIEIQSETSALYKVPCVVEPPWPKDPDYSKLTTCNLNKSFANKSFFQVKQRPDGKKYILIPTTAGPKLIPGTTEKVTEVWYTDPTTTQRCELESSSNCSADNFDSSKDFDMVPHPILGRIFRRKSAGVATPTAQSTAEQE